MNIFKNLMFLQGYLVTREFADDDEQYGQSYGNAVASRRSFGDGPAAAPHRADRRDAQTAGCAVGGCS